ncbi:GNAT family N-acetyltransferase [Roseiflexus sp.]|uniref:GNAT family N-acetyltransferase n=1 Tax=Roseiflexus sp. TaxID=2562120 RepID=UPI00398AA118
MKPPAARPYRHPDDLEPVVDLILTCRAEERIDPWPPVHDIRARLGDADDARLWIDANDRPVAFAMIWEGNVLIYVALPGASDETLEMQAVAWALEQARTRAELCGERAVLCVPVRDDDPHRTGLLTRAGLRLGEWHMIRMHRWLHLPIDGIHLPPGFTLRSVAGDSEAQALVDLHHIAFATTSKTLTERIAWMHSPACDPRLDLVAVAPDGTLAAFCRCSVCPEERVRLKDAAAWIDLIGVHPAYRRQGLGRALLLQTLQHMRSIGLRRAWLSVGSWNTPAQRLFESCGFAVACRIIWLVYDEELEVAV